MTLGRRGGRRKLIEISLPLVEINQAAAREKSIRHGHPSTLHLWWARRPLAAARAVLFAQLVDDPSDVPEEFPTEAAQTAERERLFALLRELVQWKNTTNERLLERARAEIRRSWERACRDHEDHPEAARLFDPEKLPAFNDPFAGGGAIPLEAQRLGLEAHASDLNPVAVLINKAMIEIPPRFAGQAPVNPAVREKGGLGGSGGRVWKGASGLAEDVRFYGKWMRDQAERRIGHLYPNVEITEAMVRERPDLKRYAGRELTVIAWLWARTVPSPHPAFSHVQVPLISNFMLSTKKGKEAYVEPVVKGDTYRFDIRNGTPPHLKVARKGTKLSRGSFRCLVSGTPMKYASIDNEANAGRMGARLMAVVAAGVRERIYLSPTEEMEHVARSAEPTWKPGLPSRGTWASNAQGRRYGFRTFGDYFTPRQLVALTTFSDLVGEAVERIREDAAAAGLPDDGAPLRESGRGAAAYAQAVGLYLALALDRTADRGSTICSWDSSPKMEALRNTFGRQAIPMVWDFAEGNPFSASSGNWLKNTEWCARVVGRLPCGGPALSSQLDATGQSSAHGAVVSTDPPYYDNVGYADLSDFFYVWLRRSLKSVFPDLFATLAVPKAEELVATPYRHGGKAEAEAFFLKGMTQAMGRLAEQTHPAFPTTVYYAYKQARSTRTGAASTGWETFLGAVMRSGFQITGTMPMRTELKNRMVGMGTNALASSIVLVCRRRDPASPLASRPEFVAALRTELPPALRLLQSGNIAPVDLAQAAIGPGMRVYSRYARVVRASGESVPVREALELINEVLDEVLREQEGELDAATRWALAWFEQHGLDSAPYGEADILSKAKNTTLEGLARASIVHSARGEVRLCLPEELEATWDPAAGSRLSAWAALHHLSRRLDEGEDKAAGLLRRLGTTADPIRELAYRLYSLSERKRWPAHARRYNDLVQAWPRLRKLARDPTVGMEQQTFEKPR